MAIFDHTVTGDERREKGGGLASRRVGTFSQMETKKTMWIWRRRSAPPSRKDAALDFWPWSGGFPIPLSCGSRRKVEIGDSDKDREHAPVKLQKTMRHQQEVVDTGCCRVGGWEAAWGLGLRWSDFNQPAACDEPAWTLYFAMFICLYPKRRRRFSAGSRWRELLRAAAGFGGAVCAHGPSCEPVAQFTLSSRR